MTLPCAHPPLVQPPGGLDRDVRLAGAVKEAVQRGAGPLKDGGVRDVEAEAGGGEELAGLEGLLLAFLRKRHVAPTLFDCTEYMFIYIIGDEF